MSRLRPHRECLGDILQRAGLVDEDAMARALERQRVQPGRFGTQLLSMGVVSEDDLAKALGIQHRVPPFLPALMAVEAEAVAKVPLELARRLQALPVRWEASRGTLEVALTDPGNLGVVDEIRFATGARKIAVLAAPESTVERLIALHYEGIAPEPTVAPEIPSVSRTTGEAQPARPRPTAGRTRDRALVADPDPRRRRALAALLEASGAAVVRAASPAEAREALRASKPDAPWTAVWVHRDWQGEVEHPSLLAFDDPVAALGQAAQATRLAREARSLAEAAAQMVLGDRLPRARQVVGLVRFLAGRRGLSGAALDCLELATWRTALAGWEMPDREDDLPGEEIVRAVGAYERALAGGAGPVGAAEAVRGDPSLNAEAVGALLRWAEGAHLLARVGGRRLLALFPSTGSPTALLSALEKGGWSVERAEEAPDTLAFDAVLAGAEAGLGLLESLSTAAAERPPIFLVSPSDSGADTMYALRLGAEDVFAPDAHAEVVAAKLERAAGRTKAPEGIVSGNLRDMGFADIVQILANGLKTGVIRLEGPAGIGEVALRRGGIVDARTAHLTGEEAFYSIMEWEEGGFRIEPGADAQEVTIQGNTEGLLMEGFRRMDEARRVASEDLPELG